jgi:hypothetical protein
MYRMGIWINPKFMNIFGNPFVQIEKLSILNSTHERFEG